MKSFFKKLAFVMAMAMVISLAAPAAANAATVITAADQDTKEAVSTLVFTLGENEEADLCFLGAPEGWRDLERGWRVVDGEATDVAEVDNNGVVKALKKGTTKIEFYMEGCDPAVVNVIVTEPQPVNEYEVAQKSEKAFTLTYANDVKYTIDDVELYILYANDADPENPIEIKWPIDKKNSKVEKNVITVAPFVQFADGQTFKFVVDGVEKTKTVTIGDITDVVLSLVQTSPEVYANVEDEDDFYLSYTLKYLSNGVDLTNLYGDLDIEWNIVSSDEDATDFEEDEFKLYFFKEGITASVQAVVTDDNKREIPSNALPASSIAQPEWKLLGVNAWAVLPDVADSETPAKFDWSKADEYHSVPADVEDEEYIIVLKLVDSRGTEYVTSRAGANTDDDAELEIAIFEDAEVIEDAELSLKMYSADTDMMLVDTNGCIGVYTETEAVFYVEKLDDSGDDLIKSYIFADTLVVTEGRRLDEIKVDGATTVEVVTKTLEGYGSLAKATVTMKAEDQYNIAWSNVTYSVDTDNDKADKATGAFVVNGNKIIVDGTKLGAIDANSVRVTVTGKEPGTNNKATATFTVNIKNPKTATATDDPDFVEDGILLDTITKTRYNEYTAVKVSVKDVDINAKDTTDGKVYAYISLYKTSNGAIVGQYTEDDALLIADAAEDLTTAQFTTEGARYITIKCGNKFYDATWVDAIITADENKDGIDDVDTTKQTLRVQLTKVGTTGTNADPNEMVYEGNGTYAVEVVTVRYKKNTEGTGLNTNKKNSYIEDADFVVSNSTPEVSFDKKDKDTYTKGTSIEAIVVETLDFKLGTGAWADLTKEMITNVEFTQVGDYYIIQSVTFAVPVDGKTTTKPHYTRTVYDINVSVKEAQ